MTDIPWNPIFGRLTLDSINPLKFVFDPTLNNIIASGAAWAVVLGGVVVVAGLTYFKLWKWLWNDWFKSVDHKKIGVMYIVLALIMLLRGVAEGVVMRAQQADGLHGGFLSGEHFGELFTTHGTIMIFFMAMPFLTGLINIVVPLQIGARDVSFPMLNSISLGLTIAGGVLIMVSLVLGQFSTGGWTAYPPYTEPNFQPGEGPDYWIWSVSLAGIGSTLTGLNFVVTIYKERAPGMTFMKMPMFTWAAFCTVILMVFAMPPLTVAGMMLAGDRYFDTHFFTNALGGNMMNFANMLWLFGHPEVYILILPAFGVFSEVFATFSNKRLYGYTSLVWATMVIGILSFTVWLHHFFTMGQSANVNAAFGIATMLIGIPTGVKIYDWMATMYRGRVNFSVPMCYAISFMMLFVIGGLSGIILANPTVDFQVHNTLFLIAHFHNVLIPGLLFGMLAGYTYWFPKVFGFRLNDFWGYISAGLWSFGFMFTFFPLYVVGLMGMTRRTVAYSNPSFTPWFLLAMFGAVLVTGAILALCMQLYVSIRDRHTNQGFIDDPWNARSLEWATMT
ncbi:cytochrome ubiquinol oxidase subunit I, partial [Thioclava sp. BHET1]